MGREAALTGRWLPWAGGLLGLVALAWVLRGFDFEGFRGVLAGADLRLTIPPAASAGAWPGERRAA